MTLDELTGHLRQKDVLDIRQVQFAILETDGSLSVFPYPAYSPATAKDAGVKAGKQYLPITIIADGKLCRENLALAGKDRAWVDKTLSSQGADIGNTLLLTVDAAGGVIWLGRDTI